MGQVHHAISPTRTLLQVHVKSLYPIVASHILDPNLLLGFQGKTITLHHQKHCFRFGAKCTATCPCDLYSGAKMGVSSPPHPSPKAAVGLRLEADCASKRTAPRSRRRLEADGAARCQRLCTHPFPSTHPGNHDQQPEPSTVGTRHTELLWMLLGSQNQHDRPTYQLRLLLCRLIK